MQVLGPHQDLLESESACYQDPQATCVRVTVLGHWPRGHPHAAFSSKPPLSSHPFPLPVPTNPALSIRLYSFFQTESWFPFSFYSSIHSRLLTAYQSEVYAVSHTRPS